MVMEVQAQDVTQEQIKGQGEVDGQFPSEMDSNKENTMGLTPEQKKVNTIENSHGTNGVSKDGVQIAISSVPKDAVDEWPTPKQIHSFYFAKYRSLEDPKLKAKIEQAEKDLQKKNQARLQLTEALKAKRSERADIISKLKPLSAEDKEYRMTVGAKRKEMRPLQDALGEMRNANIAAREKGMGLCSSVEELDDIIRSLHYRMQHESLTLNEEKRMLKEIKQLEGTRAQVIASASEKAKIQDSSGHKQNLQGQVKSIGGDIDEVRKEQLAVKSKISVLENDLNIINQAISSLQEELEAISEKRNLAYESLRELRAAREEMNARYFRNRTLLNSAKDIAVKKDVSELQKLCYTEVENFMSEYSSNKEVREDYEMRILLSLDMRQLSRDGRMRNADEKPILYEAPIAKEPETAALKKGRKEDVAQPDIAPVAKGQDDNLGKARQKTQDDNSKRSEKKLTSNAKGLEDSEDSFEIEKPQKELPKAVEFDAAKLKELKREEEIAKAKQALERKKKLAEKASAKAAVRAQKEAEKKLKEKEKKAKKKAGVSATAAPDASSEETETDTKVAEPEEENENLDAPVPAKSKEPKENIKYRSRPKSREQITKVILKRKKSNSYWLWAAPMAAAVLVLAMLGYYFAVRK